MNNTTNRETKEIEIKGNKFVLLSYTTGREMREIQTEMFGKVDVDAAGKVDVATLKGKADIIFMQPDKYLELVVKSVNGSTEDILNTVLNLPSSVYNELLEKVTEIAEGKETATN